MLKIELLDIYPHFSEISADGQALMILFQNCQSESKNAQENIVLINDNVKDHVNNVLSIFFPVENLGKKEEKIKIKLNKQDSNSIIGIGEIVLPANTNQKNKKDLILKKWYNINSSSSSTSDKSMTNNMTASNLLTKRNNAAINFAMNLINTIKIHLQITQIFSASDTQSINESNANIESQEIRTKSLNSYLNYNINSKSNNHTSNKIALSINNTLESKSNKDNNINNNYDFISNNNLKNNLEFNIKNKSASTNESKENNTSFNEVKEKSSILSKISSNKTKNSANQNNSVTQNNLNNNKKHFQDNSNLSHSLNATNFQSIKNSLNSSLVLASEKRGDNCTLKERTSKNKNEILNNTINSFDKTNKNNLSQTLSINNEIKRKNISMIDPNSMSIENKMNKSTNLKMNNVNDSPKLKSITKKKDFGNTSINTIRSTTNHNSLNINLGKIKNILKKLNQEFSNKSPVAANYSDIKSVKTKYITENKRNLSTTKLLSNTNTNTNTNIININNKTTITVKQTPQPSCCKNEKSEEIKLIDVEENVEKKQSDSIITNSFIDEIFSDEKLEYLDNPLDENDFVTLIEEFKAIYNSSYVNILPEEETYLTMELKMIFDKFTDIQSSYHKNLLKFSEDNNRLNDFLKTYGDKFYQYDKKIKRLDHLIKREKLQRQILSSENIKKEIFNKITNSNNLECDIMASFVSGKMKNIKQEIQLRAKQGTEKSSNLILHKLGNEAVKQRLFEIIKNVLKNPKNQGRINGNILEAYSYLQESFSNEGVSNLNDCNNNLNENEIYLLDEQKNKNKQGNLVDFDQNNYYSPHFSKVDPIESHNSSINNKLIDSIGNSLKINHNNNCTNIITNSNFNNFNSNNTNFRLDNNLITLNDIHSPHISPETYKNNNLPIPDSEKAKYEEANGCLNYNNIIHESSSINHTEKSLANNNSSSVTETKESNSNKIKDNALKTLLEEKLKLIYFHKPNYPKVEFRNLSGPTYFYGSMKLKLLQDSNNPNIIKVTWKKNSNYITTTLEEFIEANALQQESKINPRNIEIISNKKEPISCNGNKELNNKAITARAKPMGNLSKSPMVNRKKDSIQK